NRPWGAPAQPGQPQEHRRKQADPQPRHGFDHGTAGRRPQDRGDQDGVAHKAASKAAGKASALHTSALAAAGTIGGGSPLASQPTALWRHSSSNRASAPPPASRPRPTLRSIAAT